MHAPASGPDNHTRHKRLAEGNDALLARWKQDPRYVTIDASILDFLDAPVDLGGDWGLYLDEFWDGPGQRCIMQIMGGSGDRFFDDGEVIVDPTNYQVYSKLLEIWCKHLGSQRRLRPWPPVRLFLVDGYNDDERRHDKGYDWRILYAVVTQ
ncbi:hypothetical protein FOA52_016187 [Chlamydomonas sp. UWO 241]|nr:hypothetical protein FOA52_016187 [Chlamydomonas sp. UWO 241]